MNPTYEPHAVEWTHEKVGRVWDYLSERDNDTPRYFSEHFGDSIVRLALKKGAHLKGRVLDFGCGPGRLMKKLLQHGYACEGLEFSERSAEIATLNCKGFSGFGRVHLTRSIPTPLAPDSFDTVFFVETIEHLLDEDLQDTLKELYRIVKPGGTLVVTTPHDEDFDAMRMCCPDCGCQFHGWQHVRTWTAPTLTDALEQVGFRTKFCKPLFFSTRAWASRFFGLGMWLAGMKLPHLAYVGRKPEPPAIKP